uniref:Putative lipocalin-2 1 n=1 Tax=Amblyomma americanum TaxID=6943 RepID=A0A0C9R5Z5_AMBAM
MAHSVITMHSLIAYAALLLAMTLPFIEIGAHAGFRIDEEPNYYEDQDIYRAFNISRGFWLHTQNFQRSQTSGRKCTYFDIHSIDKDGMNYTSYYTFMNGTKGKMPYFGRFYKTPTVIPPERTISNALNVSETSGYPCMVLVSDQPTTIFMPRGCKHRFNQACNRSGISEQIYEDSCDKTELLKTWR